MRFVQSLLLLVLLCGTALAQNYTFTGATDGNWNTAGNWSCTGCGGGDGPPPPSNTTGNITVNASITSNVPNLNNFTTFVINSPATVTTTNDLTVKNGSSFTVNNGATWVQNNSTMDWDNGSTVLIATGGTLTVNNPGVLNNSNSSTGITINGTVNGNGTFNSGNGSTVTGGGTFNLPCGTCNGTCPPPCPSGTLPVTWLSFALDPQADGSLLLRWSTANELNNSHFTLERSRNASDFEPVAVVPGAGTVNEVRSYAATDAKPIEGRSFYRVRQTDLDGTWAASAVLEYMGSGTQLALFPVPARRGQPVAARFDNTSGVPASLVVVNVQGGAEQAISLPTQGRSTVVYIPTTGLNPGSYQVVLTAGSSQQTAKFVIAE